MKNTATTSPVGLITPHPSTEYSNPSPGDQRAWHCAGGQSGRDQGPASLFEIPIYYKFTL